MIHAVPPPGLLADLPKLLPSGGKLDFNALSGVTPVLLVTALVLVAGLVWAMFLRRPARDRRARFLSDAPPSTSSGRRHRRHRRREHRPTNPTLAETGGLPPLKPDPTEDGKA